MLNGLVFDTVSFSIGQCLDLLGSSAKLNTPTAGYCFCLEGVDSTVQVHDVNQFNELIQLKNNSRKQFLGRVYSK